MPIQNLVSSEKNNITVGDFVGDKDRLFFDVATRTFRLSDGVTPGGIVVNTGGGGGGSYTDFSVDLHLNRATASSGEILSWSGTDYAWIAPGIQTSDLSLTTNSANGSGALTYNNGTGAFAFTPPDLSGFATTGSVSTKIGLSDLSIGTEGSASGDGDLSYDNATGVFTYTPPDLSSLATAASVASKIELTDLSVGAEGIAQGDGAIEYNNATGVFKYTPPDLSTYLTSVAFADLTGKPTTISGYGITDALELGTTSTTALAGNTTIPADVSDLTDTTNLLSGANYTDSSVDAHLNQSNPTSGYVLSWNGSDYVWVAQSGGGGTTVNPEFTESVTIQSDQGTSPAESESVIFYGDTTTNAPTRLYRNSSNASISVPAQTTITFEADIVGRHNSSTDFGSFKIKGVIDRDGSNNTQLIMSQKEVLHAGANNLLDANIVADNTNELLAVEVTGESTKTIRWSAIVRTTSSFQNATLENAGGSSVPTQFALPQTNYIVSTPPTGNSSTEGRTMVFNPAGTVLHVGGNSDDISYYDLSSAWDISTATIDQNKSFRVTGTPWTDNTKWASNSFTFNANGSKVISACWRSSAGNIGIFEYTMSTNYEIASVGTTPSASASVTAATLNTPWNALKSTGWATNFYSGGRDLKVKLVDSGTKIVFFTGYSSSYLDMQIHPLTVAYDISTIDYSTASVIGCYDFEYELTNNIVPGRYSSTVIHGDDFQFSSDGTVLWMSVFHRMGTNPPGYTYEVDLFKFNLSTPWNVTASSLSYDGYRALGENAVGSDYKLTERLRSFHIEESQNKIFMHLQELFNNQGTNIQSSYSLAEFSYS
tara:strand:+ start:2631 stop:5105 length:2475 start_codon:yes stop_codon:yes gene_type:complete